MRTIPEPAPREQAQSAAARVRDAISEHAEYKTRANENAPRTAVELRAAALGMLRDGHGDYGIAAALGLDVAGVRRLVGLCADCGE